MLDRRAVGRGRWRSATVGWRTTCVRIEWDQDGLLTSVWDLELHREVLADGRRGNLFQLHEDHPKAFDAWDVDRSYLDRVEDLLAVDSIEVVERDPLRAGVRFVRRFGASTITQTMRLSARSRRLEFHTEVDWHEHHRFLKVAFPVAVRATRATYEIQHGHLERPTHRQHQSGTRPASRCAAHRWADLSEAGYGVALLNDCKYGYDIRGQRDAPVAAAGARLSGPRGRSGLASLRLRAAAPPGPLPGAGDRGGRVF